MLATSASSSKNLSRPAITINRRASGGRGFPADAAWNGETVNLHARTETSVPTASRRIAGRSRPRRASFPAPFAYRGWRGFAGRSPGHMRALRWYRSGNARRRSLGTTSSRASARRRLRCGGEGGVEHHAEDGALRGVPARVGRVAWPIHRGMHARVALERARPFPEVLRPPDLLRDLSLEIAQDRGRFREVPGAEPLSQHGWPKETEIVWPLSSRAPPAPRAIGLHAQDGLDIRLSAGELSAGGGGTIFAASITVPGGRNCCATAACNASSTAAPRDRRMRGDMCEC